MLRDYAENSEALTKISLIMLIGIRKAMIDISERDRILTDIIDRLRKTTSVKNPQKKNGRWDNRVRPKFHFIAIDVLKQKYGIKLDNYA